jgi:hypothetical protein
MDHFYNRVQDNAYQNDVLSRTFKSTLGDLMGDNIPQNDQICASQEALPHPIQNLPEDFEEVYINLLNAKTKLMEAFNMPLFSNRKKIIEKYVEKIEEQMHTTEKLVKHLGKLTIDEITKQQQ